MQITLQSKDVNKTSGIGKGIEDAAIRNKRKRGYRFPTPRDHEA